MQSTTKPKRPKSRYAQKRAGTITPGPAGILRPLLDAPRLTILNCRCGRNPVTLRIDPAWMCTACVVGSRHLDKVPA